MMMPLICSCRNKIGAKLHVYLKEGTYHKRLFRGPSTNDSWPSGKSCYKTGETWAHILSCGQLIVMSMRGASHTTVLQQQDFNENPFSDEHLQILWAMMAKQSCRKTRPTKERARRSKICHGST